MYDHVHKKQNIAAITILSLTTRQLINPTTVHSYSAQFTHQNIMTLKGKAKHTLILRSLALNNSHSRTLNVMKSSKSNADSDCIQLFFRNLDRCK